MIILHIIFFSFDGSESKGILYPRDVTRNSPFFGVHERLSFESLHAHSYATSYNFQNSKYLTRRDKEGSITETPTLFFERTTLIIAKFVLTFHPEMNLLCQKVELPIK